MNQKCITDRQVEIMTATICDVIANKNLPPNEGKEMVGQLIRAMVTQVSRLNAAVTYGVDEVIPRASSKSEASRPSDVKVRVTISNAGQPVAESAEQEEERIRAFGRLAR
ncbi:hypothetical protein LA345_00890 [Burkholderia vietnamiensis]|nr:hypothetical protein [Burkholderia vietnamiensis]